jgi:hypothetical protein
MLLRKLDILLNGAIKHQNQPLIEEFGPLRETWRSSLEHTSPC